MANKYKTVSYIVTPSVLETHGGNVGLTINGIFPENYFDKNATLDFTPVLVYS